MVLLMMVIQLTQRAKCEIHSAFHGVGFLHSDNKFHIKISEIPCVKWEKKDALARR